MGYGLTLITPPADEPLTVAAAKQQVQLAESITFHDAKLEDLIVAARNHIEEVTGKQLLAATWELILDRFPRERYIYLPRPPLASITSLQYIDTAGVTQTFDAANYFASTGREPGRLCLVEGADWPTTRAQSDVVRVRFVSGYATPADVPAALRHAALLAITHWFNNRGDDAKQDLAFPAAAQALLQSQIPGDEFTCYGPAR
jgi:uncharacterized phiE125 gp8 family phage protein